MLSVCQATDTRGCGRFREGLYTHRGLAYSPRNVFDVLVYLYENYGAPHACPDADSLTKRLTAAGFDDEEITEQVGVNVLGTPPHVVLFKAADSRANGRFEFSQCSHHNIPYPRSRLEESPRDSLPSSAERAPARKNRSRRTTEECKSSLAKRLSFRTSPGDRQRP